MIPSHWKQITVNQFIELRELNGTAPDSVYERYLDILLTVSDIDLEELEDMPSSELGKMVNQLKWLAKEPHTGNAKTFGEYELIPFNKITWGMFIDLEYYYSQDYIRHLPTICGILCRRVVKDEWNHTIIEPYNYDPIERGEVFLEMPITAVYGIVKNYLDFRNDLINDKYANLFSGGVLDEEEPPEDPQDRKEWEEEIEAEKRFNKWAYESVTYKLANNDITKMDDILNMGLIYVLNMLAMGVDLDS